jgi:uncharacterized protein (TIGR04255 family)
MTELDAKINPEEDFPHLSKAPIVEAVIELRTVAEAPWEREKIQKDITGRLAEYPQIDQIKGIEGQITLSVKDGLPAKQTVKDLGWVGLRLWNADRTQSVQFNKANFLFSRLTPYTSWKLFSDEALRLWNIHRDIAHPTDIQRIGLRYINRISANAADLDLKDFFRSVPEPVFGLNVPIGGFLHKDVLMVSGHSYAINVIKTIQPPAKTGGNEVGIILDIDVFSTAPCDCGNDILRLHLDKMRWLKNKVFFGTITENAQETLI